MEQVPIDAQALVDKMTLNYAGEIAKKDSQIANLQVTVETLQVQIKKLTEENDNVEND